MEAALHTAINVSSLPKVKFSPEANVSYNPRTTTAARKASEILFVMASAGSDKFVEPQSISSAKKDCGFFRKRKILFLILGFQPDNRIKFGAERVLAEPKPAFLFKIIYSSYPNPKFHQF